MRTIFISYRREDAEGQAGRLFGDLAAHFGAAAVFMDVAGIAPGRDFRRVIDEHVSSCGVLLALIGKGWIDAKDDQGQRRIEDPMDFVRLETVSALKRDIPVVPVLVHGARMPRPEQLPDDMAELAYRNGVELTHARWDSDVQVLIKALAAHVDAAPKAPTNTNSAPPTVALTQNKTVKLAVAGALAALVIGGGGYAWHNASSERDAVIRQAALQEAADKNAAAEALEAKKQDEEKAVAAELEKKQVQEKAAAAELEKRLAQEKAIADKREALKRAQEKAAAAELEKRLAQEKAIADKREALKRAQEKAIADKREAERQAQLKMEADRIAAEKQNCLDIDDRSVEVKKVSGSWKVVDDNKWLFDFGANRAEARNTLEVLRHYRADQSCFVGRPNPGVSYILSNGSAPTGSLNGEDCVSFNPNRLSAERRSGQWKVVEGGHLLFGSRSRNDAQKAVEIIQHHQFTRSCFVGRPNPSFKYLRR